MKTAILFFLFSLISFSIYSQQITLLDNICNGGSNFSDFAIGPNKERFYLLRKASDTICVNDEQLYLEDTCRNNFNTCPSYLVALNNNGEVSFVENLGFSGGQLIAKESSVVLFLAFGDDTLFVADTFFVRPPTPFAAGNMIALEFSFDGHLMRAKHWPSNQSCWFSIDEVNYNEGAYIVSGTQRNDTLMFDNETSPPVTMFNSYPDVYTALFDSSWSCQWIRAAGGSTTSMVLSTDVDKSNGVYSTGYSDVGAFICEQDTMFGVGSWGWSSMWLTKLDSSGNCQWLRKVDAAGDGVAIATLSGGGAFVAGSYYSTQASLDDTIFLNPGYNRYYVIKYDANAEIVFAGQFENDTSPIANDMATTTENAVWICGAFANDWSFGNLGYAYSGNGDFDAFLLKLDNNGNPVFAASVEGKESDIASQIESGIDNNVFILINSTSDTLLINGQAYFNKVGGNCNILLEIKDVVISTNEMHSGPVEFNIYPNPISISNSNKLYYKLSENKRINDSQVILYSLYGQLLRSFPINEIEGHIKIGDLMAGIYIVQLKDQNGNILQVSKLIVQ